MAWIIPRSAINEVSRLRERVHSLQTLMSSTCGGVRTCVAAARSETNKLVRRMLKLPEHVPFLRQSIAPLIFASEECPALGFEECQLVFSRIRYHRIKLLRSYNITLLYLESVQCVDLNCVAVVNATLALIRGEAIHNQRALANLPLLVLPLEYGLPVVIFFGIAFLACILVWNAGYWWNVWGIRKKDFCVLIGLMLNAAFEMVLFSILTNQVTDSRERVFAFLRVINNRFELIVLSVALFIYLASWIEVVFSEVHPSELLNKVLQKLCFVGSIGVLLAGVIIMIFHVVEFAQVQVIFIDYTTLALATMLIFLTLCLFGCVGVKPILSPLSFFCLVSYFCDLLQRWLLGSCARRGYKTLIALH
jgi:hypothetical protein